MRIIAGSLKGRKLFTPKDRSIRPTSDRVRENLFNILNARVPNARFLDVFCGVGACGIEALSRGAAYAAFVDESREALRLVRQNVEKFGISAQTTLIPAHLPEGLPRLLPPFHIIFADPPYAYNDYKSLFDAIMDRSLLLPGGLLIIETSRTRTLPMELSGLNQIDRRMYGDTALTFFLTQDIVSDIL